VGRPILITGGYRGIGSAVSRAFRMSGLLRCSGLSAAGVALTATIAGCTHPTGRANTSTAAPSLTAPSTTSASQDPAATGRSALDAYRSMWNAYLKAVQVPDPTSPELARYATGDALTTLTKGLQSLKDQGLKGTGEIGVSPKITAFSPAGAPTDIDIADCLDTTQSHIVRASPGSPYNDTPGGHRRVQASVQRQSDGSWKVSGFGVQAVGTC
jgi:hypothetical protein